MTHRLVIGVAVAALTMTGAAFAQQYNNPNASTDKTGGQADTLAAPMPMPAPAASASTAGQDASVTVSSAASPMPESTVTVSLTTNGPVPDTRENRAKYGAPMSRAGKMTAPAGN